MQDQFKYVNFVPALTFNIINVCTYKVIGNKLHTYVNLLIVQLVFKYLLFFWHKLLS